MYQDEFYVGVAVPDSALKVHAYQNLMKQQFNSMTMENYIRDVICWTETNYPGVIYAWDVVNEAVADPWATETGSGKPCPLR